jgi:hypothetical protein
MAGISEGRDQSSAVIAVSPTAWASPSSGWSKIAPSTIAPSTTRLTSRLEALLQVSVAHVVPARSVMRASLSSR